MFADSFVELAVKFVLSFFAQQTGQQQNETANSSLLANKDFKLTGVIHRLHCSKRSGALFMGFQRISFTLFHKINTKLRKML